MEHGEDRRRSELVTLYINEHPEIFNIDYIEPPEHLNRPEYRLTIDTAMGSGLGTKYLGKYRK